MISHPCPKCGGTTQPDRLDCRMSYCPSCKYVCGFSGNLSGHGDNGLEELLRRCMAAGIGREYLKYTVECSKYVQAIEDGGNVFIYGDVGTGKSVLAANIARELIAKGHTVRFVSVSGAIQYELDTIGTKNKGMWESYTHAPILVLDDIGKAKPSDYTTGNLLFTLCEERNRNCLPTIATSNYSPEGLLRRFTVGGDSQTAKAIVRRICEAALMVPMDGMRVA